MKQTLKSLIVRTLEAQVSSLRRKNKITVIAVVGSIGKTSTKLSIARALSISHAVRFQDGNYNDSVTVPLVFFGQKNPEHIMNIFAWVRILISNQLQLLRRYPYECVVLELGTDGPGQIEKFGQYLRIDLAVITAITPEHMEYFEDLNAVAREEFSVLAFSDAALINADLCESRYYSAFTSTARTYGTADETDYHIAIDHEQKSYAIDSKGSALYDAKYKILQLPRLYSSAAAVGAMDTLDCSQRQIREGAQAAISLRTPGRLSLLEGQKNSTIIDDTYNASPEAVKFALDVLEQIDSPQKIAILGSMNELGAVSSQLHEEVGQYCKPSYIDLLITIGESANAELAAAAEANGCKVERFKSPYYAGEFVRDELQEGAAVLAKGSQNGVFAEEALKSILANKTDEKNLVRQSPAWLKKKRKQFGGTLNEA